MKKKILCAIKSGSYFPIADHSQLNTLRARATTAINASHFSMFNTSEKSRLTVSISILRYPSIECGYEAHT